MNPVVVLVIACYCCIFGRSTNPRMDIYGEPSTLLELSKRGVTSRQAGAITLDPVSIISLLALGAFLINNILQLLRTNQMMNQLQQPVVGRSMDISRLVGDMENPVRNQTRVQSSGIWSLLADIGAVYFVNPRNRKACMNKVLFCRQAVHSTQEDLTVTHDRNRCQILNRFCNDQILQRAKTTSRNTINKGFTNYAIKRVFSG